MIFFWIHKKSSSMTLNKKWYIPRINPSTTRIGESHSHFQSLDLKDAGEVRGSDSIYLQRCIRQISSWRTKPQSQSDPLLSRQGPFHIPKLVPRLCESWTSNLQEGWRIWVRCGAVESLCGGSTHLEEPPASMAARPEVSAQGCSYSYALGKWCWCFQTWRSWSPYWV